MDDFHSLIFFPITTRRRVIFIVYQNNLWIQDEIWDICAWPSEWWTDPCSDWIKREEMVIGGKVRQRGNDAVNTSAPKHNNEDDQKLSLLSLKPGRACNACFVCVCVSPGMVLLSPRVVIFLSRMRRPLLRVFRNCASSSLITSFTISGSFFNSGKASPWRNEQSVWSIEKREEGRVEEEEEEERCDEKEKRGKGIWPSFKVLQHWPVWGRHHQDFPEMCLHLVLNASVK